MERVSLRATSIAEVRTSSQNVQQSITALAVSVASDRVAGAPDTFQLGPTTALISTQLTGNVTRRGQISRRDLQPIQCLCEVLISLVVVSMLARGPYAPRYVTPAGVLKKTSSPNTFAPDRVSFFPAKI